MTGTHLPSIRTRFSTNLHFCASLLAVHHHVVCLHVMHTRALHSGRAGLYNFEKPSGRAVPRNYWAGPSQAGQHTARKIALMTSLISDSINSAV